ncbi:MAG: T9SS type A sorting domain-containing protein [Flavobacteriales bacterium]
MKNFTFIFTLVFMMPILHAQYTTIPDSNFEAYLEANGMGDGIDNNQQVLTANINTVTFLNVNSQGIYDLTGIEDFTALEALGCSSNYLSNLDFSQNLNLETLVCSWNFSLSNLNVTQNAELRGLHCAEANLTTLDLSQNAKLEEVYCNENNITSLTIASPFLTWLDCYDNQLNYLDVTSCPQLYWLHCYNNQLSNIDLSQNYELEKFNCQDNNITSLDVSNNTLLSGLAISFNNITNIDVSQNLMLDRFTCLYNNISSIDLRENSLLTQFICSNNPNLNFLDVRNGANENIIQFYATDTNLDCVLVDNASGAYLEDWYVDEGTHFANSIHDCEELSANELIQDTILIYPNPANNFVFINTSKQIESRLFDINGRLVKERTTHTGKGIIIISDLEKGVYFLNIETENKTLTKKIIKR